MITVGLVGCGAIGTRLAHTIEREFHGRARIVALYDVQRRTAHRLAQQLKRPPALCTLSQLIRRSQLIIANHPTLIDVVFLISIFPQADCVIKQAVTRNPFMRSTVSAANYISNSEPEDVLDSCVARLESGGSLLLFPEGTRSTSGHDLEFKLGAAAVAARACAEILPVVITCVPGFLSKQDPWYKVPRVRPHVTIRIMPATTAEELAPGEHDQRQWRRSLNDAILALITRELD